MAVGGSHALSASGLAGVLRPGGDTYYVSKL
jgi:hypothetical protein